ncbi:hypothetical protein [Streptomyces sp. LN325]|uniref:hypothetical protein n=1 Tax=Streptomyces sp. LN325 TaxID=3112976 RepID=UPI003710BF3F
MPRREPRTDADADPGHLGAATPPTDHYAENHGFMVPFPLRGRERCEGLAAVARVEGALEPLRGRGDFAPNSTRDALDRPSGGH